MCIVEEKRDQVLKRRKATRTALETMHIWQEEDLEEEGEIKELDTDSKLGND